MIKPKRKSPRKTYTEPRAPIVSKKKTFDADVFGIGDAQQRLPELIKRAEAGEIIKFRRHKTIIQVVLQKDKLLEEIKEVCQLGHLPDGDGVNIPTLLWAEGWWQTFDPKGYESWLKGDERMPT